MAIAADVNEYTDLVAGAHAGEKKFKRFIFLLTDPLRKAQETLAGLKNDFDLDLAEGEQLDAVGVRVGFARRQKAPITDAFFAFDNDGGVGFDLGVWYEPKMSAYGFIDLPDGIYRACLKFKVALNHYDGSSGGAVKLAEKFSDCFGLAKEDSSYSDNQDMTVTFSMDKTSFPPAIIKLFESKALPFSNAGVGLILADSPIAYLGATTGSVFSDEASNKIALG